MDAKNALNIVAGLCSKKEYCLQEIREKLKKWDITEKDTARILDFLVQNKFIDENRFAFAYARDKFRFNKWGKQKIILMLKQKQIPAGIIRQAVETLDKKEYNTACLNLLLQKKKSLKNEDPLKDKNKLIRFALSRGFDYDTIRNCLHHPEFRTGYISPNENGSWDE